MHIHLIGTTISFRLAVTCAMVLCCATASSQTPYPHFRDVARESGLTVSHISGEKRYILESMSGGVGLFDCDNDGKLDIVVVNGSTVDRFRKGGDPLVTL